MEGPSLFLAQEQLSPFKKKKVLIVSGNTKIGKERLAGKTVLDIFSWGKHLVFQFDSFAIRIHFLLFGTFEATVDGKSVTGDYKRTREPRLALTFSNGTFSLFNGSIKIFEEKKLKSTYDFSQSIMSPLWDSTKALAKMEKQSEEEIADVLLDQDIFAGVGNMIKNEVLSIVKIHPKTQIKAIPKKRLREIINETQAFSQQFYEWRKQFVLTKHLLVHRKSICPHCGGKITREKTGKRNRWSHYCPLCQPLEKA